MTDYRLEQVADYLYTIELALVKYEAKENGGTYNKLFGGIGSFKRNWLKQARSKRIELVSRFRKERSVLLWRGIPDDVLRAAEAEAQAEAARALIGADMGPDVNSATSPVHGARNRKGCTEVAK